MLQEDMAINDYVKEKQRKKHDWKAGRKFIAFILCLISIIAIGIIMHENTSYEIIILFSIYVTGNVVQKATRKGGNDEH